jgi:hypothetical protein
MGNKDGEPDIRAGTSMTDARPGSGGDGPDEEYRHRVVWEIRYWRMRQFMWGWCWAGVFDIGFRLINGEGTYLLCAVMALMAGLAHWYGRGLDTPVLVVQR